MCQLFGRAGLGSVVGVESGEEMVTVGVGLVGLSTTLGAFDGSSRWDVAILYFHARDK